MIVVVSPYHLTTREPPAMASLLLAQRVVTLLPAPFDDAPGSASARRAAARSPWYSRFVESWSWSVPLWKAGVIDSRLERDDAFVDMRDVVERIRADDQFLALRPLMRDELFENEHTYLSALGADVLKGGPDPGVTVPLAAALDRFARRHGLLVARAQPVSIVQRAEFSLARTAFAIALPVLLQASGEQILHARDLLEPELRPLREAIDALAIASVQAETARNALSTLESAGAAYARAFDRDLPELTRSSPEESRVIAGAVVITGAVLPAGAVLRSSLVAVGSLLGAPQHEATRHTATTTLPVPIPADDSGYVLSLVVKPMGQPARRR